MPWFRKRKSLKLKRKRHLSKKDISKPTNFQHCYHAVFDNTNEEFDGLPPQWSSLLSSPKLTSKAGGSRPNSFNSLSTTLVASTEKVHVVIERSPSDRPQLQEPLESVSAPSTTEVASGVEEGGVSEIVKQDMNRLEPKISKPPSPCGSAASSKVSLASSTSLGLAKRPSPIVRGSENCLEETMDYIRKHYRSASHGYPITLENARTQTHSETKQIAEEDFIDIHFGSRSRAGSMVQLQSSPVNRRQIVSFTSGTSGHPNNRLPPSSFSPCAPNEVAHSDLGLYDCELTSEYGTMLSRINSPSGSSGYFGSTRSSLNSSRMSSFQQLTMASPASGGASSQCTALPPSRPLYSYQREHPEMVCCSFKSKRTCCHVVVRILHLFSV